MPNSYKAFFLYHCRKKKTPNISVQSNVKTHFTEVNYKAWETWACQRSPHSRCPINRNHSLPQAVQWALKYKLISIAVCSTYSEQRLSKQHRKSSHFFKIFPHPKGISIDARGACFSVNIWISQPAQRYQCLS